MDGEPSERASSTPCGSARLSSRPSMHKLEPLEPLEPERLCGGASSEPRGRRRRGASEPRRSARCFPL